ncbi:MAG: hypothetical protein LC105_12640 [Chitinophagales bacterium]|nr:hypothetical protein [Chitinophagales bacterium]
MNKFYFGLYTIISLLLVSCASVKELEKDVNNSSCFQQPALYYDLNDIPISVDQLEIDSTLRKVFSFRSLNVANAIGVLDLLSKYHHLKNAYSTSPLLEKKVDILETSQIIFRKINNASLEISSFSSELDCEEERATQLSKFLKSQEDSRENALVIGSIIIGAGGAIASEVLSNHESTGKSSTIVAIGTSLTEASLGIAMLLNNKKVFFKHERNSPAEIWNNPKVSQTFPPSIWYYLTYEYPNGQSKSLRALLVESWKQFGQVENDKKNKGENIYELYFGKGGKYTGEQLRVRADMYDQIESYVTLIKQDLRLLSIEFEKL